MVTSAKNPDGRFAGAPGNNGVATTYDQTAAIDDEKMLLRKQKIKDCPNRFESLESLDFLILAADFRLAIEAGNKKEVLQNKQIHTVKKTSEDA